MVARKVIKNKWLVCLVTLLLLTGCGSPGTSFNESSGAKETGEKQTPETKTGGVTVTNIHSSPKELGVGDLLFTDLNKSTSLDFAGVDPSAEFLLVFANTASSQGNFTVSVQGDLSDPDSEKALALSYSEEEMVSSPSEADFIPNESNDITEGFHLFLREQEKELEFSEMPTETSFVSKSVQADESPQVSLGDTKSFKVLSNLGSTKKYVSVSATAKCVGQNVIFYVDSQVSESMLSQADIQTLCQGFDPVVKKEEALFGTLSDVDGNGKVIVLMTPQVNRLGGLGGGIITGFFYAPDLYPENQTSPASNYMEILYIMVPDPQGNHGPAISRDFALSNLLPSVLPHELQHAISYNQHVFVYKGVAEEAWLNEGLSHLAEDLLGQGQENPSRYALFLQNPHIYSLITAKPSLGNRGAAYLFLRFLYEQSEKSELFIQRLIQSPLKGIKNIEDSFQGSQTDFDQFSEFFLRWTVALAINDQGISQDPKFTYKGRAKDSQTNQWQGVLTQGEAKDGRGTVLKGISKSPLTGYKDITTLPATAKFYTVSKIKDKLNFSNSKGEGDGFGVLIRTK